MVIFTDGRDFDHLPDGSGYTAYWKIDPRTQIDKVIIYHVVNRDDSSLRKNYIYTATPKRISGPFTKPDRKDPRYKIVLSNIRDQGTSDSTWPDFGQTGSNPIRYVAK